MVVNLNAQLLVDVPDQYTLSLFYDTLILQDYIDLDSCYDLSIGLETFINAADGHPDLSEEEYQDYRENMTLTLKLKYAGFELEAHPNDKLWIFDEDDNLTEVNTPFDDPFSFTGQLYFLNVKGNFTRYMAKMIYYNGAMDRTFILENAFEYESNKVIGEPLQPFVIDFAPIVFSMNGDMINAEIISESYTGGLCLNLEVKDCDGNVLDTDNFCYEIGEGNCPENLMILQSEIDIVNNRIFRASGTIISSAKILGHRNIAFSAQDSITLDPGFQVVIGSQFAIDTIGCY